MVNATVSLNVPALADSDIWFANSQAWSNYWAAVPAQIDIEIDTTAYVAYTYNGSLVPANLKIDGIDYALVTMAQYNDMKSRVDTLNTAFELLKTELRNAGLITN